MASRSCESLLQALALPELVARDEEAYVEQAVRLASEPDELARIRGKILDRSSPLFDTAGRVREIEAALLEMWDRYLNRSRPA
jgi:predicted O-linked N-acetylglucosamine transferase (SPINDLY family)